MPIRTRIFLLALSAIVLCFYQSCSKGDAINEPKLANLKFTTYTIDTFQFRVILNGTVLTDTLRSPQGLSNNLVTFYDTTATIQIENAITNQVYLDSTIQLKTGQSTISIVQFQSGQNPFLPSIPNEPPPAAGNYKVRFQFVQPSNAGVPFLDSVQCIVRLAGTPVDTLTLSQYETTPFYEAMVGVNFSLKIEDPVSGSVIDNTTNNLNSNNGFSDFNTAILYSASPSSYLLQRIY